MKPSSDYCTVGYSIIGSFDLNFALSFTKKPDWNLYFYEYVEQKILVPRRLARTCISPI